MAIGSDGPWCDRPKFSVVIPAWNAASYIEATLWSLRKQAFASLEVIVMDGASTDGTAELAKNFEGLAISVISAPDRGQLEAVQNGCKRAKGEIICWLNSDDVLLPGTLRMVAATFAENPDTDLVYSDDFAFDEARKTLVNGGLVKGLTFADHLLFYRQMYSECIFWRREKTRYLPEEWYDLRVATDYAFFLNLRRGLREKWVPKRLGAFRIAPGQVSQQAADRVPAERARIKAFMHQQLGWSPAGVLRRRILRAPSFWVRHRLRPAVYAAMRALRRTLDNGARRRAMAEAFYKVWLNPAAPHSEEVERLLLR